MTIFAFRRRWLRRLLSSTGALVLAGGWLASASAEEPVESAPPPVALPAPVEEAPRMLPEVGEVPPEGPQWTDLNEAIAPTKPVEQEPEPPSIWDENVTPAGCSSCGVGTRSYGCGGGRCIPGRERDCDCCFGDSQFGRLVGGLYECLCCPDPCYEPRWIPVADSAFWLDAARPTSHTKLYWNNVWDFRNPDAAEWFWAQIDGKGPSRNGGPVGTVDYKELRMYTEAGNESFSAFVDFGYRRTDPEFVQHAGNFGDLIVGTKSVLLDCELLVLTFQFKTFIPTGSAGKGLGTGHVSLEPSLLANLRLSDDAYLQSQLAYWIPVGGTGGHQGAVFHHHFSFNKVIWSPCHDLQLVGVGEFGGFHISDGLYTRDDGSQLPAKDVGDIFYLAPGLRLFICERIDFGASYNFALTDDNFGDRALRFELRWRY